jgi:hypothetical protein
MMKCLLTAGMLAATHVLTTLLPARVGAQANVASQPTSSSQASLPEGFVLYEGQKDQFTIAIPQGWVARNPSQILQVKGASSSLSNIVYFYLAPQTASQDMSPPEVQKMIRSIDAGDIPSFFVQKLTAEDGMSCGGFSEKAQKSVFNRLNGDPMFSLRAIIVEMPRSEAISLGGCKGVRVYGTGQADGENTPRTTDIHAVSDGKVLYLFVLRGTADNYKKNAGTFKKSLATARLTEAK